MDSEQGASILATGEEEITLKKKELAVIIICVGLDKKSYLDITAREMMEALSTIPEIEVAIAEWRGHKGINNGSL